MSSRSNSYYSEQGKGLIPSLIWFTLSCNRSFWAMEWEYKASWKINPVFLSQEHRVLCTWLSRVLCLFLWTVTELISNFVTAFLLGKNKILEVKKNLIHLMNSFPFPPIVIYTLSYPKCLLNMYNILNLKLSVGMQT